MICQVPVEVQEAEEAALAAAPAAEVLAEAVLEAVHAPAVLAARVPVVSVARRVITIIAPILVGDSVRAVITVAAEDASAR